MQQDRTFDLGHIIKGFGQFFDVVPVERAEIIETEPFEQHARSHEAFQGFLRPFRQVHQIPADAGNVTKQVLGFLFKPDERLGGHLATEK